VFTNELTGSFLTEGRNHHHRYENHRITEESSSSWRIFNSTFFILQSLQNQKRSPVVEYNNEILNTLPNPESRQFLGSFITDFYHPTNKMHPQSAEKDSNTDACRTAAINYRIRDSNVILFPMDQGFK
jgi:hypothetical protein